MDKIIGVLFDEFASSSVGFLVEPQRGDLSMAKILDFGKIRGQSDFGKVLRHYGFEFPDGRNQLKLHCLFHDEGTPRCR